MSACARCGEREHVFRTQAKCHVRLHLCWKCGARTGLPLQYSTEFMLRFGEGLAELIERNGGNSNVLLHPTLTKLQEKIVRIAQESRARTEKELRRV